MCLKTTMSKYFRNISLRRKKKKNLWGKKKKEKARIFFRGTMLFTQSPCLVFFFFFLRKGWKPHSSVKAEHSKGCERSWCEHQPCSDSSRVSSHLIAVSFQLRDRGNYLYKWLPGERPQQFVYANQVVPANHALFSVVSVVCKCTESEQGIYS